LSTDEINLDKNAARKAWAEECMMDASDIAIEIRDSQQEFSVWDKTTVTNQLEVSPGPRDTHYVVVQLEDDPVMIKSSASRAGKHFKNSTLIQMDKEGGYQIVHGPKLYEIEANNIKILFNGHGDKRLKTTGQRVADNIVDHVVALKGVLPVQSSIDTVAIKGCNPGDDFGKDVARGLKAMDIETKVSSRLGVSRAEPVGRNTVNDRYHLDEGKVVWGYKDGELTQLDPYTDDNYHLVVSVGEDGSLQLNRSIEGLKGKLKIRVMASDFDTTLAALKKLENQLPDGTSMAEINIKMGNGSADWYATHGVVGYSDCVSDLSSKFNANVLTYSPSGPNKGSYACRYERDEYTTVKGLAGANGVTNGFVFYDTRPSDDVGFFYRKNKTVVLYNLAKRPSHNKIPLVLIDSDSYSEQELLGHLKGAINQIEGSVSKIKIITKNTAMSDDDYKSMMKFLSKELHVRVEAYNTDFQIKPWLSINPGDTQVKEDLSAKHLAETQPYND
ncbi:C80 family cysteine peptidase, partial [Bathymodiolus azoricus thioautotrophic gill symbiont]